MLIDRAKDLIEDSADDMDIIWDDEDDDDDGGSVIKL